MLFRTLRPIYMAPCVYMWRNLQPSMPEKRGKALLFTISVLGSFKGITQHTGQTAYRPIPRMKELWLWVLLKDISQLVQ